MLALTLALLSGAPPGKPRPEGEATDAQSVLTRCARTPLSSGTRFTCGSKEQSKLVLSAVEMAHGTLDMARESRRLEAEPMKSQGAKVVERPFKHRERSIDGVFIAHLGAFTTWLVLEGPTGTPRMLSCTAASEKDAAEACPPLLHLLVDVESDFFVHAAVKPMFAGQPKGVPVNCKVNGVERAWQVACGANATFSYSAHKTLPEATEYLDKVMALLSKSVPGSKEALRDCHVGDTALKCRVFERADVQMWTAIVEERGQQVAVTCTQPGSYPGFHRVCSDVFSP